MAVSDPQAYFITDLAYQAEIDIPNEIALLSAGDDESVCEMAFPPLSSVSRTSDGSAKSKSWKKKPSGWNRFSTIFFVISANRNSRWLVAI